MILKFEDIIYYKPLVVKRDIDENGKDYEREVALATPIDDGSGYIKMWWNSFSTNFPIKNHKDDLEKGLRYMMNNQMKKKDARQKYDLNYEIFNEYIQDYFERNRRNNISIEDIVEFYVNHEFTFKMLSIYFNKEIKEISYAVNRFKHKCFDMGFPKEEIKRMFHKRV